ncbi:hypothetical protein EJ377_07045 [Chryseobacterium arthrosphaerae]|uniref:Uncharacterized protein n=1 Tax=Chryseobacterium arthrosphaerae TaxID=651561 RepID=A0A3S0N5Z4_9FLAO|nr:hypothetical protein EJ377_07045 [Chryseobacterium arthrosphaerae]
MDKQKTKVQNLGGNPRHLLSLYSTLSKTDHIILDVVGQGLEGSIEIYKIVNEVVKNGGSAILLDNFNDMKDKCTKYIELQWINE